MIGPKSAADLRDFIEARQPDLPSWEQVEELLALLDAALPKRAMTDEQANAIIEQYWQALQDVPLDALNHAYSVIMRSDSWFPTVARIREAAETSLPSRYRARRMIAKTLLMKHRNEWRESKDEVSADEMASLRAEVAAAFVPPAQMATAAPRPKVKYCSVCHFSLDNPQVSQCSAENCGKALAA